jgi:hypothetical protein
VTAAFRGGYKCVINREVVSSNARIACHPRFSCMTALLWIAVLLFVLWIVVKFVLALTGLVFHLLWIIAIVLFLIWLAKKLV